MINEEFVCLSDNHEVKKQLYKIFDLEEIAEPLLIAKKFNDGDSENIFVAAVPNGENSILQ